MMSVLCSGTEVEVLALGSGEGIKRVGVKVGRACRDGGTPGKGDITGELWLTLHPFASGSALLFFL